MVGNMRIADHGSKKYSRLSILKYYCLLGEGEGDGGENDIEIAHLIGTPPLAVPEHPEEYLVV